MKDADVGRLKNILKYHIIEAYILQIPTLEVFGQEYIFQTLIPGEDGKIVLQRNERYAITVNSTTSLSTTVRSTTARSHNYRFNNGIAHVLNDYVRNKPF